MPRRRPRHVDPVRVHLITLVVFGVIAGAALALWTFPKFFGLLALIVISAIVYSRLYSFIEARLEAEEGRLAEELGFDLGDEDESELDEVLPPTPRPKRKTRRAKKTKAAAEGNGTPAPTPVEPPPIAPSTTVPPSGST